MPTPSFDLAPRPRPPTGRGEVESREAWQAATIKIGPKSSTSPRMKKSRIKQPYRYPGPHSGKPKRGTCPRCHAETINTFRDATPAVLDGAALTQAGELDALISGLRTFHVTDLYVSRRTAPSIARHPAIRFGSIHAEHKCGRTAGAGHLVQSTIKAATLGGLFTETEYPF